MILRVLRSQKRPCPSNSKVILNCLEVGQIYDMSEAKVKYLCRKGWLPSVKSGKDYIMHRKDIRKPMSRYKYYSSQDSKIKSEL